MPTNIDVFTTLIKDLNGEIIYEFYVREILLSKKCKRNFF